MYAVTVTPVDGHREILEEGSLRDKGREKTALLQAHRLVEEYGLPVRVTARDMDNNYPYEVLNN